MGWRHFIHSYLWQRLPRRLRRQVLFQTTALIAPQPGSGNRAIGPFIVAGFLQTASGLGEGARLCHDALARCGFDVYGIDLTAHFSQPGPVVPFSFRDGGAIEGPGTIILHVNSPFVPLALTWIGKRFVKEKRIIGYWVWELPAVPSEWRIGLPFVHEIWVPSQFTANALAPITQDMHIRIVPHPVAVRQAAVSETIYQKERPFTALLMFNMASSFARKNPMAAIAAFKRAFGDDPKCRLVIRMLNATLYPEGYKALMSAIVGVTNIELSDGIPRGSDTSELYSSVDVVLSLHRSEGFGLILAEAMLHGLPIVATNWSGNVDYLTPQNSLPVGYSLVSAVDPQGTYDQPSSFWAEADIGDAVVKLCGLRDNPDLGSALGRQAAFDAAARFGVDRYRKALGDAFQG